MAKSSKRPGIPAVTLPAGWRKDPRFMARAVIGTLLALNLIAAWAVFSPVGGSAEQLEAEIAALRSQIQQRQASVARLRSIVGRVHQARTGTDQFFGSYFMSRRTASSTIVSELIRVAKESGMTPKEHSFEFDPVEGTEDMAMMTVRGTYQGSYGDLLQYVNRLDKSPRFLIMDSLNAAPLQGTPELNITVKLNTFVWDHAAAEAAVPEPRQVAEVRP